MSEWTFVELSEWTFVELSERTFVELSLVRKYFCRIITCQKGLL